MKNQNVPKLRFKGFNADWTPQLLGNTCRVTTGGKDTQDRIEEGAYPFFVRSNTVERINSYSFDGEAILTSGDGVGVGKNFHYINGKFDFHQRVYALLEFKKNYSGKFIYHLFVEKFHKRVMRLSAKNSVDSVRMNMITEMNIFFPTLHEQTKIASFLSSIDEKIQHLTRKKELLEQYKKGVMQQLFSGKLRFRDEKGKAFPKWEEKRLGEIGEIVTGKTPSTSDLDLWDGNIQFVTPTDINENKYQFKTQRTIKEIAKTKLLPIKSILFTCIASIGKMSLSIKPCVTNQQINSIIPSKEFDNEFIYYSLLNISEYIKSTQSTTTLPIINKTEFSKFKIDVPTSLLEQQKIAIYLSNLDNKIDSINKQITQTQLFKKGLLQQMFV